MTLYNIPHQGRPDRGIPMNEPITEGDNILLVGDSSDHFRKKPLCLAERLADDFKASLYGRTQHCIALVIPQLLAVCETDDVAGGLLDVPQIWRASYAA